MGIANDPYGAGACIKAKEIGTDQPEAVSTSVVQEESFGRQQLVLVFGEGEHVTLILKPELAPGETWRVRELR